MSMIDRSLDGVAYLSGQLGFFMKRRLREVCGIALISIAGMAALALASWSVKDPSLSHATDAHVHNLLGVPGAIGADLMMQLLGLGSLALVAADRGLGLSAARPPPAQPREAAGDALDLCRRTQRRVCIVPAAKRALAAALRPRRRGRRRHPAAARRNVPRATDRQLPLRRRDPAWRGGSHHFLRRCRHALARGSRRHRGRRRGRAEEEDEAEDKSGWFSLGGLMHTVLSLRARIGLLLQRRAAAPAAKRSDVAMPRRRIEPRFGNAPAAPETQLCR